MTESNRADSIRVLLADDHPIILDGLKLGLKKDPHIEVVAQANNGRTALELIQELRPDVAIIDIDMPKLNGIELIKEAIRLELNSKIILLTLHNDEDLFHDALELGAKGYLLKDSAVQEVITAVNAVAEGRLFLSSAVASGSYRTGQLSAPLLNPTCWRVSLLRSGGF